MRDKGKFIANLRALIGHIYAFEYAEEKLEEHLSEIPHPTKNKDTDTLLDIISMKDKAYENIDKLSEDKEFGKNIVSATVERRKETSSIIDKHGNSSKLRKPNEFSNLLEQGEKKKPYDYCEDGCPFISEDGSQCRYRENHIHIVAVDFDKVLFRHEQWNGHKHYGEPMPDVYWALHQLKYMGFKIMVWTTRNQPEIIAEAMERYSLPYDYINENPHQPPEISPAKPVADYYIDDRGVHFTDWVSTIEEIKRREIEEPYYPIDNVPED